MGNNAVLDHGAVAADSGHKVDGVTPTVSSVAITSDPGDDSLYRIGDAIEATVRFHQSVVVGQTDSNNPGVPSLNIVVGSTPRMAEYVRQDDNGGLVFSYTVVQVDKDTDGIAIAANSLGRNGSATIRDGEDNDAILDHAAVAANSSHRVDGALPTVTSVTTSSNPESDSTYGLGEVIEIKVGFSEPVLVSGIPTLIIDIGGDHRTASKSRVETDGKSGRHRRRGHRRHLGPGQLAEPQRGHDQRRRRQASSAHPRRPGQQSPAQSVGPRRPVAPDLALARINRPVADDLRPPRVVRRRFWLRAPAGGLGSRFRH